MSNEGTHISLPYDPFDWYWIVAENSDDNNNNVIKAWSSLHGEYTSTYDAKRVTHIDTEESLTDVLRQYNLPGPKPTIEDYRRAIQTLIDSTAQSKDYENGVSCASYVNSSNPLWAEQAYTFIAWRDAVWVYVFGELAKISDPEGTVPSVEDILNGLPVIEW